MTSRRLTTRCTLACMVLCLALGGGKLFAQKNDSAPDVGELLLRDGIDVDVMELRAPARMDELSKMLQQAVNKDPDWWTAHLKKAKPGEPLPYDKRMGITKKEYEEFLGLANKQTLVKVKVVKARVKRDGQRIALSFGDDLADFKQITIDLKADTVTTPFGIAKTRSDIEASDGQKATGPWDGIQWKLETIDERTSSGTSVKFALGKLKESGRGLLYYDVKQITAESKTVFHYVLQYDLPRSR